MKDVILMLVLILTYSCGTDRGKGTFYKYTIKNNSGKAITIKGYITMHPDVSPIITNLSIGEELTKTYQDGLPPSPPYRFANFFGNIDNPKDSIKVVYNNSKVSYFIPDQNDRNPLNSSVYNKTEETFVFTQQDYENAADCNGNCDQVFTIDKVSSYTIKQLKDALRGAKSWTEWRNRIKNLNNNVTEEFLFELFNNWE